VFQIGVKGDFLKDFIWMMEKAKRFWKLVKYSSRKVHLFQIFFDRWGCWRQKIYYWQVSDVGDRHKVTNIIGDSDVGNNVMFVILSGHQKIGHQNLKSVTNILNLSPTHFVSNICHQHRCHHIMILKWSQHVNIIMMSPTSLLIF